MKKPDKKKVSKLISEILENDDDGQRRSLADQLLAIDPGNPIGKYIIWQSADDPEDLKDTTLLAEAVDSLRPAMESYSDDSDESLMIYSVFLGMLSDLASFSYINENKDLAFEAAAEFLNRGGEDDTTVLAIHYASFLERGEFEDLIRVIDENIFDTLPGEYCRAIAVYEMEGFTEAAAECLLNAISLVPDLPFYLLGIWQLDLEEEDQDEDDDIIRDMLMTIPTLSEIFSANDERIAFLSVIAFAFGYITGRIENPDIIETIEDAYRKLGCLEAVRESRDIIHAMIADGSEEDETDEKALSMFAENDYFGFIETETDE